MTEISSSFIQILANANNVVVLTGAGVSAESGIKTFRDPDGLWARFNPAELASPKGFMSNPELVWEWYQHRREIVHESKPNPGHYAIAELETLVPYFTLITQNVDRLHQQAGSKIVYELHGNIIENHCFRCGKPYIGEVAFADKTLPKCPECGGKIRPSVVWFGEMLPEDAIRESEKATNHCDVFFSVGTSTEVYPAASLPYHAKKMGAYVVEINPNDTSFSSQANLKIKEPSGQAMPEIIRLLKEYKKGNQ